MENVRVPYIINRLLNRIDSKYLGLCYDSSHDILYSETPFEILEYQSKRLLCTHLSDNDGKSDSHWLPYQGVLNWEELINKFPFDYNAVLSLEVFPKIMRKNLAFYLKH